MGRRGRKVDQGIIRKRKEWGTMQKVALKLSFCIPLGLKQSFPQHCRFRKEWRTRQKLEEEWKISKLRKE